MRPKLSPARIVTPGRILAREIEASNLTHADLVKVADDFPETVQQIIQGIQPIDEEVATKLAQLFHTSTTFWLNLQRNYKLRLAEKALEQSAK